MRRNSIVLHIQETKTTERVGGKKRYLLESRLRKRREREILTKKED
jgi:hypothetical protein